MDRFDFSALDADQPNSRLENTDAVPRIVNVRVWFLVVILRLLTVDEEMLCAGDGQKTLITYWFPYGSSKRYVGLLFSVLISNLSRLVGLEPGETAFRLE